MKSDMAYIKVLLTIIAVAAVYAAANTNADHPCQLIGTARATTSPATQLPQGGVPDSGLQFQQIVERLGESNGQLISLNLKLDALLELLKSGKLEVVANDGSGQATRNGPARAAESDKGEVRKQDEKR